MRMRLYVYLNGILDPALMLMLKPGICIERYHGEAPRLSSNNEGKIGGCGSANTWERNTTFHQPWGLLRGTTAGFYVAQHATSGNKGVGGIGHSFTSFNAYGECCRFSETLFGNIKFAMAKNPKATLIGVSLE